MTDARQIPEAEERPLRGCVEAAFDELQRRVAHQREALLRCLDELSAAAPDPGADRRCRELEDALREAIAVLEETKRSFKSKRLGELREKLARVLVSSSE